MNTRLSFSSNNSCLATINPFAPGAAESARAQAELERRRRIEDSQNNESEEYRAVLRAKESLAEFVKVAWPILEPDTPLVWGWHMDVMCAHLEAVTFGLIRRLIINVPPGHSKSLLTSVLWPAWMWLRSPGCRILCASYGLDLAIRDATKTKDLILDDWYQTTFRPEWKIRSDSKAKQNYQNTARGSRKSMSVGAGTTGNRGNGVIIDDPLSIMNGFSEAKRHEARTWLFQAAQNRLADPRVGWIVMIMQRVHAEDPTGAALEKLIDKWELVCLPSEFEPARAFRTLLADLPPEHPYYERFQKWGTDPRKEAGTLLFPEFFTKEVIDGQKEALQALAYAGQHQQRPTPAAGNIFQGEMFLELQKSDYDETNFKFWDPKRIFDGNLKIVEAYFAWDTAMKDKTTNDFTAGLLAMLADDGYVYLYPICFQRMEVPDVEKRVALEWVKWKNILGKALKGARIEEGAGTALIQYIRRLMVSRRSQVNPPAPNYSQEDWDTIRNSPPLNVFPFTTSQKKIEKAYEVLPFCAARSCRLLDTPISGAWLTNLLAFPLAGKDDPVDATVNAIGPFAGVVKGLFVMSKEDLDAATETDETDVDVSVYAQESPVLDSQQAESEEIGALVENALAGLFDGAFGD
ncbi:hypothetical protein EON83_10860 [bacterium]|nr:MAG: hypothetical protein EON83_10860 [bacterium]